MWNPSHPNQFSYLLQENKPMKKSTLVNLSEMGIYTIVDLRGKEITTEKIESYKNEIIFCKEFDSYRKNIIIY